MARNTHVDWVIGDHITLPTAAAARKLWEAGCTIRLTPSRTPGEVLVTPSWAESESRIEAIFESDRVRVARVVIPLRYEQTALSGLTAAVAALKEKMDEKVVKALLMYRLTREVLLREDQEF